MLFIGIILLVLALILFLFARSQANRLRSLDAADTYTARLLGEVHRKITTTLGGDALAQPCDISGTIEADPPLLAPLSGQACVAYTRTVTREYEERVTETDSNGNTETRTERRSETLETEERRSNFWVRDETGRTLVRPEGAELDLMETTNRYDEAAEPWRGSTRTLGRRHTERALPVGTTIFVLGCAVDFQGQPAVARHPADGKQSFIISRRNKRELTRSAASWSRNLTYAAAGSSVLGVLLMLFALLTGG